MVAGPGQRRHWKHCRAKWRDRRDCAGYADADSDYNKDKRCSIGGDTGAAAGVCQCRGKATDTNLGSGSHTYTDPCSISGTPSY